MRDAEPTKKIAPFAAFACFLIGFGFVVWQSSQPTKRPIYKQATKETDKESSGNHYFYAVWEWTTHDAITVYTFFLALFTGVLGTTAIVQIRYLRKADETARVTAQSAKSAAEAARETLIASHRAWVRPTLGIGSSLNFTETGASTAISFELVNVGNSPAINVTMHAWLNVFMSGPNAWEEQKRKCAEIRKQPTIGFSLFPNERFPLEKGLGGFNYGVAVKTEEIQIGRRVSSSGKHIMLYVYGCVDYSFPSDPAGHHQTGFVYELRTRFPGLINADEVQISQGDLRLNWAAFGWGQHAD